MSSTSDRMEFAPPPTPGLVRAVLLAIVAHALLLLMLAVGVQWKREAPQVTAEAELWSAIPEQAAAPAPEETPPPVETPEPPKPPQPAPEVKPAPPPPAPPKVDIALEKEKARLLKEKQLQQEKAEQEKQKLARLEQEKKDKLQKDKQDKEKREKLAHEQKQQQDQSAQKAQKAKEVAEAKKLEELRQQNLKRIAGMAGSGGSGDAGSTGTAAQSSGPSASYIGRIRARIKPNITYLETIVGNPKVEIDVRTSPDGTIISRKVVKSSGVKAWDEAALNAIDKTAVLPRDENGRVPSALIIVLSPQELLGQ